MFHGLRLPKWTMPYEWRTAKQRRESSARNVHHRRLLCEPLEDRRLLSVAPLKVMLISDSIAQAQQISAAATNDTIAVVYHADGMTTAGLANLLASVSNAHDGAAIEHLGIVAHGSEGAIELGSTETLCMATLPSETATLKRLQSLLTDDARLDLYSCSVAAGAIGRAFVDEISSLTHATVYASDDPVGTVSGADFVWEYVLVQRLAKPKCCRLTALRPFLAFSCTPQQMSPVRITELPVIHLQQMQTWDSVHGTFMGVSKRLVRLPAKNCKSSVSSKVPRVIGIQRQLLMLPKQPVSRQEPRLEPELSHIGMRGT